MAATVKNHFHIFDRALRPTHSQATAYHQAMAGYNETPAYAIEAKRALSGALIKHVLRDGGGNAIAFRDNVIQILCSRTDMLALTTLVGTDCYLVPLYHDDATNDLKTPDTNGYNVFVTKIEKRPIDPFMTLWLVAITVQEDTV